MFKAAVFLLFAFFALLASAIPQGKDEYGKDANKYYPQDQKGLFKDGVFLISSKCTRFCNSHCGDPQILKDKAGINGRFATRLAKVLKGACNYQDTKGCGCYVPDDDSCAEVYTCAAIEQESGDKCRPKPVLITNSDRPCGCPKTCEVKSPGRTRLSDPNVEQPDRTRLMSVDDCPDGSTEC